jgi:hypothetical protein
LIPNLRTLETTDKAEGVSIILTDGYFPWLRRKPWRTKLMMYYEVWPTRRTIGPVPLLRLRQCECKWPTKHDARVIGGYLFCGRPTDGHSYCAEHRPLIFAKQRYVRTRPT